MQHVRAAGVDETPEVLACRHGGTLATDEDGRHWELARFVPGTATPEPTPRQTAAAVGTLARLHVAAAGLAETPPTTGPSPGMVRRVAQAQGMRDEPWEVRRELGRWTGRGAAPGLEDAILARLDQAIAAFARGGREAIGTIAALRPVDVTRQAVLRDVWADHVLFAADEPARVAGIIDWHAAGIDTPATDLARLLGSWRSRPETAGRPFLERWPDALAAYERIRPLADAERRLIPVLHATAVVFGLDHWFRWTLDEGRSFARPDRVLARLDRLLEDLPAALRELADRTGLTG
jgi:Ser/Thr protein kinase RdoA (MazF antagonist)